MFSFRYKLDGGASNTDGVIGYKLVMSGWGDLNKFGFRRTQGDVILCTVVKYKV